MGEQPVQPPNENHKAKSDSKITDDGTPGASVDVGKIESPKDPAASETNRKRRKHKPISYYEIGALVLGSIGILVAAGTGLAVYWQAQIGSAALVEIKKQYPVLKGSADAAKTAADTSMETSHIDQRPWINITVGQTVMQDGIPIKMPVRIINSGKTPAYKFKGTFVVNLLKQGDQPDFNYASHLHPKYVVDGGVLIPNVPTDLGWVVLPKYLPLNKPIAPIIATSEIRKAINDGSEYIVVHGEMTYSDIFGTQHWLKFCSYAASILGTPEKATADTCGPYNDVDKNH